MASTRSGSAIHFILVSFLLAVVRVGSIPWSGHGVVEFNLVGDDEGLYNPTGWVYRAELNLGSPAKTYKLQIDTGSDITWIRCNTTLSATKTFEPSSPWNKYRLDNSSTVSILRCGDKLCGATYPRTGKCKTPDDPCPYSVRYADGGGSSGFYLTDIIRLRMRGANSQTYESRAFLVFGCATKVNGYFRSDGVLGIDHERASIIRQLEAFGKFPGMISHCVNGGAGGGGFLLLGEVEKISNMSYAPLDVSRHFYRVQIEKITVDEIDIGVNINAFTNTDKGGTSMDAGSRLISLVPEAYNPLMEAISMTVNLSLSYGGYLGLQCYSSNLNESLINKFPTIHLKMKGGALIVLRPRDYIVANDTSHSCIGIMKSVDDFNSLGAIALKDQLFEYDLNKKMLGWGPYNCSLTPNTTVQLPIFPSADDNCGAEVPFVIIVLLALVYLLMGSIYWWSVA